MRGRETDTKSPPATRPERPKLVRRLRFIVNTSMTTNDGTNKPEWVVGLEEALLIGIIISSLLTWFAMVSLQLA